MKQKLAKNRKLSKASQILMRRKLLTRRFWLQQRTHRSHRVRLSLLKNKKHCQNRKDWKGRCQRRHKYLNNGINKSKRNMLENILILMMKMRNSTTVSKIHLLSSLLRISKINLFPFNFQPKKERLMNSMPTTLIDRALLRETCPSRESTIKGERIARTNFWPCRILPTQLSRIKWTPPISKMNTSKELSMIQSAETNKTSIQQP